MTGKPWMVSLHGGHSGEFCDHAKGTLREILESAVAKGFSVYGVTEHAPRIEPRFLYPEEVAMGWDVAKVCNDFERYAAELRALADEFAPRMMVLRGFEAEVVPSDHYIEVMGGLRDRLEFDYVVGSVHFVDDIIIDYTREVYAQAAARFGGIEPLAIRYYQLVNEMVRALNPEVVGHFDIIRRYAASPAETETPAVREVAMVALDAIAGCGAILDMNTARRAGGPYPAPWVLKAARERDIPVCFGDDSHSPEGVGAGIEDARELLIAHGFDFITTLVRHDAGLVRREIRL
jgi:histidinol-phosphatase (PHP family)